MSTLNGKRAEAQQQGRKIKVAILGAGGIAHAMALTLNRMADDPRYTNLVEPYAVAARDGERAADFARQYGLPVSYGSYEEMLADPEVDLVYIATPHSLHAEQGEQCLRAGKNILVEKSFTANTAQAERLLATARETGLLCTEAIWTRYMPSRTIIHDLLASGIIGEIRTVSANLGYTITGKARLTDPALAGGALLDVGVYPQLRRHDPRGQALRPHGHRDDPLPDRRGCAEHDDPVLPRHRHGRGLLLDGFDLGPRRRRMGHGRTPHLPEHQ